MENKTEKREAYWRERAAVPAAWRVNWLRQRRFDIRGLSGRNSLHKMWKCSACGESVGDLFDACWKCQEPKPTSPLEASGIVEQAAVWVDNFQETQQPNGTIRVQIFGQSLSCTVCGNRTFRERSSLLNTAGMTFFKLDWANKSATNFICSKCGYVFWFLQQP